MERTRKNNGILEYICLKGGDYSVICICSDECHDFIVRFIHFILLHYEQEGSSPPSIIRRRI